MNLTLFKREIKSNYKLIIMFLGILTMYSTIIVAMFDPKLGESLQLMAESMPEFFSAFGMTKPATTLIGFIANYLYGFILIVIPMIFIIVLANKLVTRYVDRGSIAYLLATPNKRSNIIITQGIFLIVSTLILVVYVTLISIITSEMMFKGQLVIGDFIVLNIGLYGLLIFFSGLCFLSACFFNDTRYAYGVGGGLCTIFVLLQMISQAGEKAEFLKYMTPLTLFQGEKLSSGNGEGILGVIVLYGVGLAFYGAAIKIFTKKDLSI